MADATVDPDVQDGKALAWLSYLGILFLIPLLAKRQNKYCQFHAKQGLVLLIAEIIVLILTFFFGIVALIVWLIIRPKEKVGERPKPPEPVKPA